MKKGDELCPYGDKRMDCFGRRTHDGRVVHTCLILNKTDFKHHDCPFYKSYEDYQKGLKLYGGLRHY